MSLFITLAADVLPNLIETVKTAKKHLNPNLSVLGVILTKVDGRQKIGRMFEKNIKRALPLLGSVHSESQLQYSVGGGSISELSQSRALDEYEAIANKITKSICQTTDSTVKV